MRFRVFTSVSIQMVLLLAFWPATRVLGNDPTPKPENTISVHLSDPVKPQNFGRALKFFIGDVIDRGGNPQPLLVYKSRGGIFIDRLPTEITREALNVSLKSADMLAADSDSSDLVLNVYLFHFGLAEGSGLDVFGKVELAVMVKNPKTGKSQQVTATGTSIAGVAIQKKNLQKNVQGNMEEALSDAIRNLLRGQGLRDAVLAVTGPSAAAPSPNGG